MKLRRFELNLQWHFMSKFRFVRFFFHALELYKEELALLDLTKSYYYKISIINTKWTISTILFLRKKSLRSLLLIHKRFKFAAFLFMRILFFLQKIANIFFIYILFVEFFWDFDLFGLKLPSKHLNRHNFLNIFTFC